MARIALTEHDGIAILAKKICDSLADAMERYTDISDDFEELMPEHFAVAYIMHRLGDEICMTMETTARTLWYWNLGAKKRRGQVAETDTPPLAFLDDCQKQSCDLVVFNGLEDRLMRKYDPFCLVELKKGHVSVSDIAKINTWLPYIDMCPYGMVSSYCEVPKFNSYVRDCREQALADGDSC
jgi:hypothetical protein